MNKKFSFNSYEINNIEGYENKVTKNIDIYFISTAKRPKDNSLIFINKFDEELLINMRNVKNSIVLANEGAKILLDNDKNKLGETNLILEVPKPRREYAKILNYILNAQREEEHEYKVNSQGYVIGRNVEIGKKTIIEPFVFVGDNSRIGERCIIKSGAKIRENTVIGNDCIVKENCVIGDEGFGMERDEEGIPYRIPHLGGVVIGNGVEVGALVSIAQGTIEPTIIEDYVKIDDCAFIAHNCRIGKGTYIIANAEISGSVVIGEFSWIGPNVSIINGVKIGRNVTVGIGSVVIKNVGDNEVIAGNPADSTINLKRLKRATQKLLDEMDKV